MMINKNNKLLDLYNGDSGILVSFQNDDTLYFMVKKSTNIVRDEGKVNDKIFKIKDFTFYPLRLISTDEIDLAYAITIHKSQGSDYKNILVILPNVKGHPLLNRQIIYTAITRTKGNTYILSNNERLNESKDRVVIRDTNII
jgi:exodeoxyribonuclease V alpha subunit